MLNDDRPDPQQLLQSLQALESRDSAGKLHIFFGMSAGVGKTYAMLKAAQELLAEGVDVVIGVVETHGRAETEALLVGLPVIARRTGEYRGVAISEMDLDAILARRPQCVLIDELAHTNAPGSRHPKRYQDVLELLEAGIDVCTTLNVQHLESQIDVVLRVTGVRVRETVPDSVLGRADQITIIDIAPTELIERLNEGKVYLDEQARAARENFFKEESLTALRELALRLTAEHVEGKLEEIRQGSLISARWNTTERLLVAVSHSPHSETLIRATRRHASAMRAPWIALNVETGTALAPSDQERLSKNLKLAQELGAEVITTADTDIVSAIERLSRQRDVTQIIVGRPTRRFWRDLISGGTILDRLVRRSHDIDIHVIRPLSDLATELKTPLPEVVNPIIRQLAVVIPIVAALTLVSFFLQDIIGYRAVGFVYLLAIVLLATRVSFWPMMGAAALSALSWNYLFIPPPYTFHINAPEDIMMFCAYFVVASISGYLTMRTGRQDRLLRQREVRTEELYDFARALIEIGSLEELSAEVDRRTQRLFQSRSRIVVCHPNRKSLLRPGPDRQIALDENEWAVATWAFEHGKIAGWSTDTLSQARCLCLPLTAGEERLGVLVFRPIEPIPLTRDQFALLMAIGHQAAGACERDRLLVAARRSEMLQESERLHQTLLNSISHELRTPLTSIVGSTLALKEDSKSQADGTRSALLKDITGAADRLNHVINNLLNMSRLNSGMLRLQKEWFDFGDLLTEVISESAAVIKDHTLKVDSIPETILVEGDYYLLKNTLANLLRNSCLYSLPASEIEIIVRATADRIDIDIRDQGKGIATEELHKVFEKFYRPVGSPAGGIGLGLSIARSIVELHGGTITALNREGGGTVFSIRLPLRTPPAELMESRQ